MHRARALAVFLLVVGGSATARADETLLYRWRLDGFVGALAGLFVPSHGEGRLTGVELADGTLRSELRITASERHEGEFFLYGAEWEPKTGTTLRAWTGQRWRGEEKSKRAEVGQRGVVDIASAIFALRRDPPREVRQLEIWSDGRLYPVLVIPRGFEKREIGGREVATRHFAVRGYQVADRRLWKGHLDLWFADDAAATPVEMVVARSAARVRLELVESRRDAETPVLH